jgi:hypothetical protein
MEHAAGIDQRMDELSHRVDEGFARMDEGFARVDERFNRVETDVRELRQLLWRFGGGMLIALVAVIVGLLGVIAAVLTSA